MITNACPAIVTVADRLEAPGLAATVRLKVPLPVPPPEKLIQGAVLETVHEQPVGALTWTLRTPPAAPTESVACESEKEVQAAVPAWVKAIDSPLTVSVAVRPVDPGFGSMTKLKEALPAPLVAETIRSQGAEETALHEQVVEETPMARVPLAPPAVAEVSEGVRPNWQAGAAWVRVNGCPATVSVVERGAGPGLAVMAKIAAMLLGIT